MLIWKIKEEGVGERGAKGKKKKEEEAWSQDLKPPGGLVFVVQAVCGVKVELPWRGCSLLFVIQAVGGVEG